MTELADAARVKDLRSPAGIDNLLYSADTYFSCFADLALTSPVDYFKEGQGSLMQVCVPVDGAFSFWTVYPSCSAVDSHAERKTSNGVSCLLIPPPLSD